jgi:WD40 repeat protein
MGEDGTAGGAGGFDHQTSSWSRIALSPDGRTATWGGQDNGLEVWDVSTGLKIATLHGHRAERSNFGISNKNESCVPS